MEGEGQGKRWGGGGDKGLGGLALRHGGLTRLSLLRSILDGASLTAAGTQGVSAKLTEWPLGPDLVVEI